MLVWRKIDKSLLQKDFLRDVEELFARAELADSDWYVTHGYRTIAEQAELYRKHLAGGPRAAPPGRSAHNYGLAVDVVLDVDPDKPGLQPSWVTKLKQWTALKLSLIDHKTLKHGASFGDWPHIERRNWRQYIR